MRICCKHFEDSQRRPGSNRLKRNAVPTLFDVPNPPKKMDIKRPLTARPEPQPKRQKPGEFPILCIVPYSIKTKVVMGNVTHSESRYFLTAEHCFEPCKKKMKGQVGSFNNIFSSKFTLD